MLGSRGKNKRAVVPFKVLIFLGLVVSGCQAPRGGVDTALGRQILLESVRQSLTKGDCASAITSIEPLYFSNYTDNTVRLLRASAYGCKAGIAFFSLVSDLAGNSLSGNAFFKTITRLFPSVSSDAKMESAWEITDSLLTTISPGTLITTAYEFTDNAYNSGSLNVGDRTGDSNMYMIFASMAVMGTTQNRYGSPNSSYEKTQDLPWITSALMDETGCGYASGMLNLLDSIQSVANQVQGTLANSLNDVTGSLLTAVTAACESGCRGILPTGCTLPAGTCNPCPTNLRVRTGCEDSSLADALNPAACAAAGIVFLINNDASVGWPTGT